MFYILVIVVCLKSACFAVPTISKYAISCDESNDTLSTSEFEMWTVAQRVVRRTLTPRVHKACAVTNPEDRFRTALTRIILIALHHY